MRQAHPTVSIRVVVDNLSLQRFGDHNQVAHELELASSCMASKLEIATKKSKVLGTSVFVRAKLQQRLAPLQVQAARAQRPLISRQANVCPAVRRARLEKSKGRVKRIRNLHGKASVPLRQRLARIERASVSKATHYGIAVTGRIDTQLQQSRTQVASCVSTRLHGKNVTMVLITSESELDPIFDSLASVITLTHALWDSWMPLANHGQCMKVAKDEQRDNARPWTFVKGPFGAAVATLARLQWTILERDPFSLVHDGRVVDPRPVCPQACESFSNKQRRRGNRCAA